MRIISHKNSKKCISIYCIYCIVYEKVSFKASLVVQVVYCFNFFIGIFFEVIDKIQLNLDILNYFFSLALSLFISLLLMFCSS